MESKKKIMFLTLMILFLCSTHSFALMMSDPNNGYEQAWHSTALWQRLGDDNNENDGVSWSVNGGAYGYDDVTVGDLVTFKFDFWHQGWGMHDYDQLKVWLDTDSANGLTGSSVFFSQQHFKNENTVWTYNPVGEKLLEAETNAYYSYTYADLLITSEMVGELFLRARVHCNHVPWDQLEAYGYLSQGEVEDYFIRVNAVPEPATMLLLGTGLFAIAGIGRIRFFKK